MGVRVRAALRLICAISIFSAAGWAQSLLRYDGFIAPAGYNFGPANVAVCQTGGLGGPPCSPLALVYSDATGKYQITQPFVADMNGRYSFYALPGNYSVQTYGTGYTTNITSVFLRGNSTTFNGNVDAVSPVFNAKAYGAKGDARSIMDGVDSNGSTTVTSATASWSAADVGKLFWCDSQPNSASSTGLTTIVSVQSATSITIAVPANSNAGSAQACVWGTQDDTAAILATTNAAANGVTSNNGMDFEFGPNLVRPGTAYLPAGGYIVSGNVYNFNAASLRTTAPNLEGEGRGMTIMYVAPTYSLTTAPIINSVNGNGFKFSDFSIYGEDIQYPGPASSSGVMTISLGTKFRVDNVEIDNFGFASGLNAALYVNTPSNAIFEQIYVQDFSPISTHAIGAQFNGGGDVTVSNFIFSNFGVNLALTNLPPRNTQTNPYTFVNGFVDECTALGGGCTLVQGGNGAASFIGTTFQGNLAGSFSMSVSNANVYLTDANLAPFSTVSSGNTFTALQIQAGGAVYSTMSTFQGNGGGAAIANSGTFYDIGGNTYFNCSGNTCNPATIAQAFTGTQPITALTHSATNPFIPTDTAQTWMQMTPDQPIRVTRIQVTPANGASVSCTVTPVFQITNGTTTETVNIANATATDDSGVLTSGNTYVAGTAITFGISAAGTCTTAPANMNVNVLWQAVAPSQ